MPKTPSRTNNQTLTCNNKAGQTILKQDSVTESKLNQLNRDWAMKNRAFVSATESLKDKERVAIASQQDWNNKTSLLNTKTRLFNEKHKLLMTLKRKKQL